MESHAAYPLTKKSTYQFQICFNEFFILFLVGLLYPVFLRVRKSLLGFRDLGQLHQASPNPNSDFIVLVRAEHFCRHNGFCPPCT